MEIGRSLSHCFDMHGGRDRRDGTDIAGTCLRVHHNTFRPDRAAVVIRGVPEEEADIHHNWFFQDSAGVTVRSSGRTRIHHNAYGLKQPVLLPHADPKP